MKIDIVSDVACPWCYVGKKNLEAAMAQRPDIEFEIQWFPYQLHPEAPSEGYDYQRTLEKKYGKERIAMMYQSFAEAGKKAGVEMKLFALSQNASKASTSAWHERIIAVHPCQESLLEAVRTCYY